MPRIPISDLSDPRLVLYRQLKASNETRGSDRFVVEGEKLVYRLLASRFPTDSVLVTDRYEGHHAAQVPENVPMFVIPHEQIEALVGYNFHRGVLATGRRVAWPDLAALVPDSGRRFTVVVCPTLDKPDNLGTILRIGEAFGVDAVLIGDRCPDPLHRRVIRVSMGAAFKIPVYEPLDLIATLNQLRADHAVEIIATDAQGVAEPLDRVAVPDRLALVLGSEAFGLEPEWLNLADRRVTIPMRPGADSLNVAVAAGIFLYHFTRADLPANSSSIEVRDSTHKRTAK
jgi:tRNA G18 (ribose-2'-O)-methylase SpoU